MNMEIVTSFEAMKFTRTHSQTIGEPITAHLNANLDANKGYDSSQNSYEDIQSQATIT